MNGRDLPQARFPKAQFLGILRAASGVSVAWITDAAAQQGDEPGSEWAWLEVGISNIIDIGWDEQRVQPNNTTVPATQDVIVIGRRQCTLNVMAYSEDPNELEAIDLCERIRFAFNRQDIHDLMVPNISLRWCEKVVPLPNSKMNGRDQLRANMDIQINYSIGVDVGNAGPRNYVLDAGTATGTLEP